jgi:hypothetical protein
MPSLHFIGKNWARLEKIDRDGAGPCQKYSGIIPCRQIKECETPFMITKVRYLPGCPPVDEWIKKCHIYTQWTALW